MYDHKIWLIHVRWNCCCGESDLLLLSSLEEHRVLEVNADSAAPERHVVTNCTNTQIHLPLRAFHHRAGRLIGLYYLLTHIQEASVTDCDPGWLWHGISSFTLVVVLCFVAAEAGLEEFSNSVFCLSLQSATSSTGCSKVTSQSLHTIDWFVNLAGSVGWNITVTSFEQPACRCPPCKDNLSDQKLGDVIKRKDLTVQA